jgi:hypothetical protein
LETTEYNNVGGRRTGNYTTTKEKIPQNNETKASALYLGEAVLTYIGFARLSLMFKE